MSKRMKVGIGVGVLVLVTLCVLAVPEVEEQPTPEAEAPPTAPAEADQVEALSETEAFCARAVVDLDETYHGGGIQRDEWRPGVEALLVELEAEAQRQPNSEITQAAGAMLTNWQLENHNGFVYAWVILVTECYREHR